MKLPFAIVISLVLGLVIPAVATGQDTAYLFTWNGSVTEVYAFPFPPESPLQQTLVLTLAQDVRKTAVDPFGGLHVVIRDEQGHYQLNRLDMTTGALTHELRIYPSTENRWDVAYDDDGRLWNLSYGGIVASLSQIDLSSGRSELVYIGPESVSLYCLTPHQGALFAGGGDLLSFDSRSLTAEVLTEHQPGPTDISTTPLTLTSDGENLWGPFRTYSIWGIDSISLWYIRQGEWNNLYISSSLGFLDWDVYQIRGFELLRRHQTSIPVLAPAGVVLFTAMLLTAAVLRIRARSS